MKKFMTIVLAAAILLCGASMMKGSLEASAKISPTAATITAKPDATTMPTPTYTGGGSTTPGIITSPSSPGGSTSSPSGSTGTATASATMPTSGSQTAAPTSPDGSTITGTVKPDENPESPKTGDMSGEVFVFAGIALIGAAAVIITGKKKEEND